MNRKLVAIFAVLAGVLLIGARFGASWAGGPGFDTSVGAGVISTNGSVTIDRAGTVRDAVALNAPLSRGEIIRTGDDSRAEIRIGFNNAIFLDNRTDVRLDDLRSTHLKITLIQGRILLDTHLDAASEPSTSFVVASTLGTEVAIPYGKASFVNYNFKNTFAAYPIESVAAVVLPDNSGTITKTGVEIHELEPVSVADVVFDPAASAAADFYRWAGLIQ